MRPRYRGRFTVEARYKSLFDGRWSGWNSCDSRASLAGARNLMLKMRNEKTKVPQEFRILHPFGTVMEECDNAKNVQ